MIKKMLCMIKENNAMYTKYKTQIRIEALSENSFSEDIQINLNKNKTPATLFDVLVRNNFTNHRRINIYNW